MSKLKEDDLLDREEQEKMLHDIQVLKYLWDYNYYPLVEEKRLVKMKENIKKLEKKIKNGKSRNVFME